MSDFNEVSFTGRLGKDPERGSTASGKARCSASFVNNQMEKSKSGEDVKVSTWFTIVAWDRTAEMLGKLKKGMSIFVKGSLKQRKYTKEGVDKEYLELTVRHLHPIDYKAFGAAPEPGFSDTNLPDDNEPPF